MSLLSGGGVGVGDSLDTLDTGLVLATCRSVVSRYTVSTRCSCRADGRLLQLTQPLAVTAAQLARMAARCPARTPHSCAGEIWSGHTRLPAVRGAMEIAGVLW